MRDANRLEDQAALYVAGQLTPAERREFEVSLAESAELRVLVQELEEGAVALAMAVPQRRPPPQLWQRIEEAVAEESRQKTVTPSLWVGWWRTGWAAAAACLAGWLVYALWINYSNVRTVSPSQSATHESQPGVTTDSVRTDTETVVRQTATPDNSETRPRLTNSVPAHAEEISALYGQIAQLQKQVGQLSQALTQQQALLADSGRPKFLQLVRTSGNGPSATTTTSPSPELQRALLLALARELGWRSPADSQSYSNQAEIDFVDLRPGATETPNPGTSQTEPGRADLSGSVTVASGTGIPTVVLGDRAYLAFDSSVVTNGTALTFFAGTSSLGFQTLGTAVLGSNRMVVTVPLGNTTSDGLGITVTAGTSSGLFNTFVPIPTSVSTPP